jgi:hypothetical protein
MNNKDKQAHARYMTPKQLEQLRFVLFAKAAQSMGSRIDQLRSEGEEANSQAIHAIRSEWVVD